MSFVCQSSLCNSSNGNAIADKLERGACREGGVYWIVEGIIFPVGGVEISLIPLKMVSEVKKLATSAMEKKRTRKEKVIVDRIGFQAVMVNEIVLRVLRGQFCAKVNCYYLQQPTGFRIYIYKFSLIHWWAHPYPNLGKDYFDFTLSCKDMLKASSIQVP